MGYDMPMLQKEALEILKTGANVFLTGEPGSGKTHTINAYIRWLRERGVEPSVTASTGIAATHVNGMTIHSWSGIGVKRDLSAWDIDAIMSREKTARRMIDAKVLIIDEISMLDAATLSSVDAVLRAVRRREYAFGGLQVIFVGDFFQLPPVSRGEAVQFAFRSPAWEQANPIVCYLSEQHRQGEGDLLQVLGAMRSGEVEEMHFEILQSRIGTVPRRVATRLYTHNADVDRMNNESLSRIDAEGRRYTMLAKGPEHLIESLKKSCLSPEMLDLKIGASVMFTRNNFEAGYVNGTLGTVAGFAEDGYPIVEIRGGKRITAEPAEWAIADGAKVLARVTQVPLRLAWAITVHKSQGLSLDAAVIDLGNAFEYGQGYVAISRVRTLDGLHLVGINQRALQMHPAIVEKDREFADASRRAARRFEELPKSELAKMHADFLSAVGGREPSAVRREAVAGKRDMTALRAKYPNMGKPWTEADDAELTRLFKTKAARKDMAAQFGRSPTGIESRLALLGLIPNPWADGKKAPKK